MQNRGIAVSLTEFLLQKQGNFGGFFAFKVLRFTMFLRGIRLSRLFF